MSKQINLEWAQEMLNDGNKKREYSEDRPQIDWVSNGKSFKKEIKFKLLPANSKENQIFSYVVATHWLNSTTGGPNKRFVCPEQTVHLKKSGMVCPVCEAKRQLMAMGFSEEDLSVQGKYGPIQVFNPTVTSSAKVVVIDTDIKHDWDQAHVSVLQQNGSFLTKWLVEKYTDADTPDLLLYEKSNLIKFSRPVETGRWDREPTFATFEPSLDVIMRLKEENEALTLPELWPMPNDTQILEIKQLVDGMKQDYINGRNAIKNSVTSIIADDDIPF